MTDPASERKEFTPLWQEFKSVPSRLRLPIYEFSYSLQYVPVHLEPEHRRHAANIVTNAVVSALSVEPDRSLTSFSIQTNPNEPSADEGYFSINYTSPVYDFGISMGPSAFTMMKRAASLQDLLLTCRIFVAIAQQLFSVHARPEDGQADLPFAAVGIDLLPVRISFGWVHHLVLGTRLGDEIEATNSELLIKLLRLGPDAGSPPHPLDSLSPGAIRRGDVNLGYTKELAGRPRQLWIGYEGPWNVTGKDVDFSTVYRLGESDSPMKPSDLVDFRTPFIEFFRDEILNGFFADLLGAVNVAARLS